MLRNLMKVKRFKVFRSCLTVILVMMLLIQITPIWAEETADTGEKEAVSEAEGTADVVESETVSEAEENRSGLIRAASDVVGQIAFSNGQLFFNGNAVPEGDNQSYKPGDYTFSIDWSTIDPSTQFVEGDYFTFQVPLLFGGISIPLKSGNDEWGTLVIDANGNGRVTFNSNVDGKQNLGGTIEFVAKYYEVQQGVPVEWDFSFGGEEYSYNGDSAGINERGNAVITEENYKRGYYVQIGDHYLWSILANQVGADWTGEVTLTDVLGPGHKMSPHTEAFWVPKRFAYPEFEGVYYFSVSYVDWEQMRQDYNELLEKSIAQGATHVVGADGVESDYKLTDYLEPGETCTYMQDAMQGLQVDGEYIYTHPASDAVVQEVEDGSFTITFPEDSLRGRGIRLQYYTKLTAAIPDAELTNQCDITVADIEKEIAGKAEVKGNATVHGTAGKLTVIKQDSQAVLYFSGVAFTLEKEDKSYSQTLTTGGTSGSLEFTLQAPYEGTYTLTEDAMTTPTGYQCGDPITLEIDSSGKITEVNGSAMGSTGLQMPDICEVNPEGLVMVVFNPLEPTGSFKMQKVDSRDNTGLSGAEFRLYYTEGTDKYYATGAGGWTADVNAAQVLTTDAQGYIQVSGLTYRTYYLEEIQAPVGYQITTSTTSVVINSDQEQEVSIANDILTTDLTIQKADADEWANNNVELLDGAEFILSYEKGGTTYYYHSTDGWVTSENQAETLVTQSGKFEITGLAYGQQYTLTETKVPVGYGEDQAGRQVLIDISLTGVVTILPPPSGTDYYSFYELVSGDHVITVTNKKIDPVDFTFRKVAAENTANWLEDAKFVLYHCVNSDPSHTHEDMVTGEPGCWSVKDTQVSDADGLITFTDLVAGEYMLVETEAPDGYQQPVGQWKIVVNANHEIESVAVVGRAPAILTQKDQQGKITEYFFTNERNYLLPLTGGGSWRTLLLIAGIGLIGAGLVLGMKFKKNSSKEQIKTLQGGKV